MMIRNGLQYRKQLLHAIPAQRILNDLHILNLGTGFRCLIFFSHVALRQKSPCQRAIRKGINTMLRAVIQKCAFRTAVKYRILCLIGYHRNSRIHHLF